MPTRPILHFAAAAALSGAFIATPVRAQTTAPVIDADTRRAVVDTLAERLGRIYVDADTGRMIAEHLRRRARAGAYDAFTDPRRLSDVLTADLQSVNGDRHLSVAFSSAPLAGPDARRPAGPANQGDQARRDHWGLPRTEVLPGNVGYMKVTAFDGSSSAIEATSAMLKFLEGTDAVIFDFRGMGGGSGQQSNFLISHFVSADTVASLVVASRGQSGRTRYTLAKVPGTRRPTVPIWVLIDRGTASAGEDFAFVLQQMGRAKTVGDRTAGAGHNNTSSMLGHGFSASISVTRVSDPRTGKEWERVGVQPDVKVPPADALNAAYVMALDSLQTLEKDAGARIALSAARDAAVASARPRSIAAETLASYAGTYEGNRVIAVENGTLVYRRDASRPPRAMVAVNDTTFILNNNLRITFARAADGMRMTQHLADGSTFVTARLGDVRGELAP